MHTSVKSYKSIKLLIFFYLVIETNNVGFLLDINNFIDVNFDSHFDNCMELTFGTFTNSVMQNVCQWRPH